MLIHGIRMKSEVHALPRHLLNGKIMIAKFCVTELHCVAERVKKFDSFTIVQHGVFTGMGLKKFGKDLCEGLKISIYLCLM